MSEMVLKSDAGNRPPVVSSISNAAEHRAFLAYFEEQIGKSHIDIAEAEQERLAYYWNALDKRLTRGGPVEKGGVPKERSSIFSYFVPRVLRDYKPIDHYQTGDLNNIFKRIAEQTRSIVLAEVTLCPDSMIDDPSLHEMKSVLMGGLESTLLGSYAGDYRTYSFGFFEIRHRDESAKYQWDIDQSSIAIPVLLLDNDMMDKAAVHQSANMLKHLQTVITLCNHDMMHNMVNTISKADISHPAEAHFKPEMGRFMEDKTGQYRADEPLGFESALVIGHAHTWLDLKNTETGVQMEKALEKFYDELERIARDSDMPAAERHQMIDYFGMSVPYALARMVPLNDPLMEYAFKRMQEIDSAPEFVLAQDTYIDLLRTDKTTRQILDNYRAAGTPLAETGSSQLSYTEIKKLQLVRIMPGTVILLSPAHKGSLEHKAHARADEMDRDIVNIITRRPQ